jgi:hypothetical protein
MVHGSRLTRIRWRLEDRLYSLERSLRYQNDAKVFLSVLLGVFVLAALTAGGFAAARALARTSSSHAAAHVVTVRQKVRLWDHGRVVTRWRVREMVAHAQTVLETQTLRTPNGIRVVTRPVTRYRVVHGKTRTVLRPLTSTQTNTDLVTVTRQVTDKQFVTVTQPVTNTVVSTETDTLPLTVTLTVTLPDH